MIKVQLITFSLFDISCNIGKVICTIGIVVGKSNLPQCAFDVSGVGQKVCSVEVANSIVCALLMLVVKACYSYATIGHKWLHYLPH